MGRMGRVCAWGVPARPPSAGPPQCRRWRAGACACTHATRASHAAPPPLDSAHPGAQYAAWRPDSGLLAVSSDGLHAVFVFNPATKQLVGSATVVCTAAALVTVELTLVELDGTTEDKTAQVVNKTITQTLVKNVTVTIPTNAGTCISTEVGNEEYATKARGSLSGVVSVFDRTVPKNDAYAC